MDDRLETDVRNATALGLSYGQYKALYPGSSAKVTCEPGKKLCPVCGKEVTRSRVKFCSEACATSNKMEYNRRYSKHYIRKERRESDGNSETSS